MNQSVSRAARAFAKPGAFHQRSAASLPDSLKDFVIVSADNHICLGGEDVFFERVPDHLKARVPRVWLDESSKRWITGFDGKSIYPFGAEAFVETMEGRDGAWNVDARTRDLLSEGVQKEIVFPQLMPVFFHLEDLELRAWIFRAYNQYLADLQRRQPGHFYGVAIPNYWNPKQFEASVQEIIDLGLKTLMLPSLPGKYEDGSNIHYSDETMAALWQTIADSGLPMCFHIGEKIEVGGRGALATTALNSLGAIHFRQNFGELVYGGVLDRNPSLKIVFCEGNLHWIPGMLQDAEMICDSFGGVMEYMPQRRPSEYWSENCYATFMHDPAGLSMLDRIGADRVMWSSDYMHNESTFGYSGRVMEQIVDVVGIDQAGLILGQTAIDVFDLN